MNHNSIFMGSSVRYNLNERVPDYDREQEDLSKAADEAFRRKHGWAPGDRDRLFNGIEHEGGRLLVHRPIPEAYEEYGIRMGAKKRDPMTMKEWMKETASRPSSVARSLASSLQNTPSLGPKGEEEGEWEEWPHGLVPSDGLEECAGKLILSNLGSPAVSPPADTGDHTAQMDRLLKMQEDVALIHEAMGAAPRSQGNSRATSRMSSLSQSVSASPALGPVHRDILDDASAACKLELTAAIMASPEEEEAPSVLATSPCDVVDLTSTVLGSMTQQKQPGDVPGYGFSPRRSYELHRLENSKLMSSAELRYSYFMNS